MKVSAKVICLILITSTSFLFSQNKRNSLNKDIIFAEDHIIFKEKKIVLGPKAFYIDGQLTNEEVAKNKYVFNRVIEASKHLTNGTEASPMVMYIAPWVYWLDNPDDPEIREPKEGENTPFGLEIECEWLTFYGLSNKPQNVILACNRGQTIGAKGNFTMLNIKGDGTSAENITFGNFCNIDLNYPLNPQLNRKKRGAAIVQAQLIFSNGDKVFARNTHFVSRLNLGPFWGSKRTLFEGCHFEMTDDALNSSAVYLNCTFDFYSSKPFYRTNGTGAVFLNCDINAFTLGDQYFEKASGLITVIDSRFYAKDLNYIGWRDIPDKESRYYQYQVTLNNKPLLIGEKDIFATVDLTNKKALNAYRFKYKNKVVYNTFNLLRGHDNWDPMGIKHLVAEAEKETSENYTEVPTLLTINPTQKKLETGKDSLLLTPTVYRFGNIELKGQKVFWEVASKFKAFVALKPQDDGTCLVIPTNHLDETKQVIITAHTNSGLESASVLSIAPSFIDPPAFTKHPEIIKSNTGILKLDYNLDTTLTDQSLISWYRCEDVNGKHPIKIVVSRFNKPLKTYGLSLEDVGYYIMASIAPKHTRCELGNQKNIVFKQKIKAEDIANYATVLIPNLENISTEYQPEIRPGFWTFDSFAPKDTEAFNWEADNTRDPWYYGEGVNGAANNLGLVQNTKGARIRYMPVGKTFGDMKLSFTAVPSKTAGQGFSSARAQYMDIGIKMDVETMSGYALRLIRTTKYSDAVDFILMSYKKGIATPISEPVSASCYRPNCEITVEIKNNKLSVHAENTVSYFTNHDGSEVVKVVNLQTDIKSNNFGGFSFQHTGTVGSGATLIKDLKVEWF